MPRDRLDIGVTGVQALIWRIADFIDGPSGLMSEVGHYLVHSILDRTSKGIDAEGNEFTEYSREYAELRELVGLPTSRVDLFFGGSMLGALTFEEDGSSVRLFFMDTPHVEHVTVPGRKKKTSKASNAAIAYFNDELRPFFAISAEEEEGISDIVEDYIDSIMRSR